MDHWTTKEVPFTAARAKVTEDDGQVKGQARVRLDECPYLVKDDKAVCEDGAGRRKCDPDDPNCKLKKWRQAVKDYIRTIDVSTLGPGA
jgi:hypothetical protein